MEKTSILKKGTNCILILMVSLAIMNAFTLIPTSNQQSTKIPKITIIPSNIEIGDENVEIGRVNKTYWKTTTSFTVKVNVSNVVDMFAWQVYIYYFPYIVNCTDGRYPKGHVFEGQQFVETKFFTDTINFTIKAKGVDLENPVNTTWREIERLQSFNLTEWIDLDNSGSLSRFDAIWLVTGINTSRLFFIQKMRFLPGDEIELMVLSGWVTFGTALLAGQTTFSGNGTLCELEFVGLYPGTSPLNFTVAETYLLNSTLVKVSFEEVSNATVIVKGIPIKEPSTITLDANPTELKVGGDVTLTGTISPPTPKVNVTISYRTDSEWKTLKVVETDLTGKFKYVWVTSETGTYRLKASWKGDKYTEGAESEEITVTVTAEEPTPKGFDPTLYVIIGVIVVIVLVALLLYFKKFRG